MAAEVCSLSPELPEVCEAHVLSYLDAVALASAETCSTELKRRCLGTWSTLCERRYGVKRQRGAVLGIQRATVKGWSDVVRWRRLTVELAPASAISHSRRSKRCGAACSYRKDETSYAAYFDGFAVSVVRCDSGEVERRVTLPCSRRQGADLVRLGSALLLHSGTEPDGRRVAETWSLHDEAGAWAPVEAAHLMWPTVHHSIDVLTGVKVAVVFGGQRFDGAPLRDCHVLEAGCKRWRLLEEGGACPGPRAGHLHCATADTLIVAGGFRADRPGTYDDVWVLDAQNGFLWSRVALGGVPAQVEEAGYRWAHGTGKALGGLPLRLCRTSSSLTSYDLFGASLTHVHSTSFRLTGDAGALDFEIEMRSPMLPETGKRAPVATQFRVLTKAPVRRGFEHLAVGTLAGNRSPIFVCLGGEPQWREAAWYESHAHHDTRLVWIDTSARRPKPVLLSPPHHTDKNIENLVPCLDHITVANSTSQEDTGLLVFGGNPHGNLELWRLDVE